MRLLEKLPHKLQNEILRFRYETDRKARLLGKLMLLQCLMEDAKESLFQTVQKNEFNKPYIRNWSSFNISHSGELVVFVYDNLVVGIDIEKICTIEYHDIIKSFHKEECEYLNSNKGGYLNFWKLWVKKESFLKAVGIGLNDDLLSLNCMNSSVTYSNCNWYFHNLVLDEAYVSYICTKKQEVRFSIEKFVPC